MVDINKQKIPMGITLLLTADQLKICSSSIKVVLIWKNKIKNGDNVNLEKEKSGLISE